MPLSIQRRFADQLGVDPSAVRLGHVGLNHLTWERSVEVGGIDVLPGWLESRLPELADEVHIEPEVLALTRTIPSYYLRYYYDSSIVLAEQLREGTRAEAVQQVERELLETYADPAQHEKPAALARRGGAFYSEAAIELLSSLRSASGDVRVVNLRNDGALPFLPDDHVIEVPARVTSAGLTALPIDPLDDDIAGLIAAVAGYERLALEACVHGSRERVLRAMMAHPLVREYDRAEKLTDLLVAHNARYLPWA